MKRRTRSQPELQRAAKHIRYEIEMIIYAGEELGGFHSSPMTEPHGVAKNLALESFLLHFRNLRAFLCPSLQAISDNDVIASDFLGKEIAEDCVDNRVFNLDEKNRLNKMLAHISYSRAEYISNGKHGWETAKMLALIIDQLEIFFATLAPMKRAWFPTSEYLSDSKTLASKLASDFEYNMCNSCLTDENHTGE